MFVCVGYFLVGRRGMGGGGTGEGKEADIRCEREQNVLPAC